MNAKKRLKTPAEARAEFDRRGVSIRSFAREMRVSPSLVYQILAGTKRCKRGASHRVAVALGMKDGVVPAAGMSAVQAMTGGA
jgi:gp16 family phage-associated protein